MKWPRISANNRMSTAKALTKITFVLLYAQPTYFGPVEVRKALREYACNKARRDAAPPEIRTILSWIRRNSLPMRAWEDTKHVGNVMLALGTNLDGSRTTASSVNRDWRIANVVLKQAIRQKILRANPLPKGKGENATPKEAGAVDKRPLLHPGQVAGLLTGSVTAPGPATASARSSPPSTTRACAPRKPSPCESTPRRCRRSALPEGKGGLLAGSVFRRVWRKARKAVLGEHDYRSPVEKRVYDLRHTCLTTWLNNGIPPAQVAASAGNSVPVLLATYTRCITGQLTELQGWIEEPQRLPAVPTAVKGPPKNFGRSSGNPAAESRTRPTSSRSPTFASRSRSGPAQAAAPDR
ncbi:integrase [Streptomyces platensis]|uniref:hypothetical protein n=1 Tax=Streptomyces platensis TaxID=58346 RepID=UPI0030E03B9F